MNFNDDKKKKSSHSLDRARKAMSSGGSNCSYCRMMKGGRRCPLGHSPHPRPGQAHGWDRKKR